MKCHFGITLRSIRRVAFATCCVGACALLLILAISNRYTIGGATGVPFSREIGVSVRYGQAIIWRYADIGEPLNARWSSRAYAFVGSTKWCAEHDADLTGSAWRRIGFRHDRIVNLPTFTLSNRRTLVQSQSTIDRLLFGKIGSNVEVRFPLWLPGGILLMPLIVHCKRGIDRYRLNRSAIVFEVVATGKPA